MKKLVIVFICIMVIIFLSISYMVYVDRKDINNLNDMIVKKTDIKQYNYVNKYDDYYIVLTNDYLYLYDNNFLELLKVDATLIYKNNKNYDIIYDGKQLMYFHEYANKNKNIYEYYNLYTYELIDKIVLGG